MRKYRKYDFASNGNIERLAASAANDRVGRMFHNINNDIERYERIRSLTAVQKKSSDLELCWRVGWPID